MSIFGENYKYANDIVDKNYKHTNPSLMNKHKNRELSGTRHIIRVFKTRAEDWVCGVMTGCSSSMRKVPDSTSSTADWACNPCAQEVEAGGWPV